MHLKHPKQEVRDQQEVYYPSKWRQYVAGGAAALSIMAGGAWFCWPAPLLPRLLAADSPVPMTASEASWMVSVIELGSLLSPLPATLISDRLGRKFCMLLSIPLYVIALLLLNHVRTVVAISIARLLTGAGMSISYTVLPLYLGEIASSDARGTVTSFFYLAWGVGCLFPYCVGPYLPYEILNYATFSLCLLFVIFFIWQPESPYFYALKNDSSGLTKSLRRLRNSPSEEMIQREVEEIKREIAKCMEEKASWRDIIATPADRKALMLILIVGVVSFFSGQSVILTYTTEIFSELPGILSADVITLCVGVIALFGSTFSMLLLDKCGRRVLLLVSSIGCMISLSVASVYFFLYYNLRRDVASYSWVASSAVICYNFFVTAGMLPVCCTYTSELFPTKTRSTAGCISNLNLTICSFVVLKLYDPISSTLGIYFVYLTYAVACMLGAVIFYFTMPETKGKTFLEIREALIKSK